MNFKKDLNLFWVLFVRLSDFKKNPPTVFVHQSF